MRSQGHPEPHLRSARQQITQPYRMQPKATCHRTANFLARRARPTTFRISDVTTILLTSRKEFWLPAFLSIYASGTTAMESTFPRALIRASIQSCRPSVTLPSTRYTQRLPPRTHQQQRTIRTIRKRVAPLASHMTGLPPLGASPAAALARREAADTLPLRTGALAIKKGMSAIYDPTTAQRTACTVLQLDRVQVIGHKTRKKNGYFAVCVGHGWRDPKNIHNAQLGQWAATMYTTGDGATMGISPKKDIREFRVRDERGLLPIGSWIGPSWFREGQFVDTRSKSKGHGFTGVSETTDSTVKLHPR